MQQPMPGQDPWQALEDLQRRVAEMERRSLTNAAITEGALVVRDGAAFTVQHPDGGWMMHIGMGASEKYFFTLRRDDGSAALELGTTPAGHQFVALWDRAGHVVASDDATSGVGLARPWIPLPGIPVLSSTIPMTNSAGYIATWSAGFIHKQQPYLELRALLRSEAGTTGNARFTVAGSAAGTVMPIAAGTFGWSAAQVLELPGEFDEVVQVEVQVQRTGGAGNVGAVMVGTQRQSP